MPETEMSVELDEIGKAIGQKLLKTIVQPHMDKAGTATNALGYLEVISFGYQAQVGLTEFNYAKRLEEEALKQGLTTEEALETIDKKTFFDSVGQRIKQELGKKDQKTSDLEYYSKIYDVYKLARKLEFPEEAVPPRR